MSPARLAGLVRALGGVDWASLRDNPLLTIESVAEAMAPAFGPWGIAAADGIALFVALERMGLIRPAQHPVDDAQTRASSVQHGHYQGR